MKIEHIGLWVQDLEMMKEFYTRFFQAKSGDLYHNKTTGFRSYFLTFSSGSRLELMNRATITEKHSEILGYAHLAISIGKPSEVDELVKKMTENGFLLKNGPRTTGDGYYEAVIEDPEGNLIEITAE